MAKRRKEELVAGVPMRRVQEFLCSYARILDHREEWGRGNESERFELSSIQIHFHDAPNRDKVVDELIARGWVEKTRSGREVRYRYQLTEAGRRLARESAHLFKWPAAQSRIRPAPRHRGRIGCLIHLHTELTRLKIGGPEQELASYQRAFLRDLEDGLDEQAMANMHDWWTYNMGAIANRGNYQSTGRPAPPRVDVSVFLSSKDNLIVEWRPSGMEYGRLTPECDWTRWRAEQNRGIAFHTRPSNGLLFIHDIRYARRHFPGMYDHQFSTPEQVMVDSILLQAAAALLNEIKRRLDLSFEVRMVTDIFTEWEEIENADWPGGKAHVLSSWTIENLAERNKNLELAELERLRTEFPCSVDELVKALTDAEVRRSGPAPSQDNKTERATKALKRAGHKVTPGQVQRYRALLERHRPDLFPRPVPSAPPDLPEGQVVPFRKPQR